MAHTKNKSRYSKEEIKEFYKKLRKDWKESKALAETEEMQAIIKEVNRHGITSSPIGMVLVYKQMQAQGLSGLPHVHAKTKNLWKKSGFQVKKDQLKNSTLTGCAWKPFKKKDAKEGEDDTIFYPKAYKLFHRSQVEEIGAFPKLEEKEIDIEELVNAQGVTQDQVDTLF